VYDRWHDYALYLQDTWKATSHLTLEFGLRWQYLGQSFSARNNIANFVPGLYDPSRCSTGAFTADGLVDPALCDTTSGIITPNTPNISGRALVANHPNAFEPRDGITWSPALSVPKRARLASCRRTIG
jgi:outer membrane receptor protein involved in Fe transport